MGSHDDIKPLSEEGQAGQAGRPSVSLQKEVEPQSPLKANDSPPNKYQQVSKPVWVFLVASIVSPPFLFGFDLIVVGAIQSRILQTLGEIDKLPWISVAYALAAMSTLLLWGRLYSVFNLRYCFLLSVIIFEAGSALSGAAPDINTLIGGRVLSGVGAIGIYLGSLNALAVITTLRQRPLYYSFSTFAYGTSTILAPIIGGAFADSAATWRWAFYINICICGLFVPGYLFLFPSVVLTRGDIKLSARLRRLDIVGNILWIGSATSGLMAISFGGAVYAWGSKQIISLFVCFGVLAMLLCAQQYYSLFVAAEYRLIPVRFLKSLEMCILLIQVATSQVSAILPIFLIPLYFELVRGNSAIRAGLYLLPLVIFRSVFILINGFFMPKLGYVMPWFLAGGLLCLAGSAPFLVLTSKSPTANVYGYSVLIGTGVGLYNQAAFPVAQARTEPALVPQAIAFITAGQIVGSAVALAVANTIFLNRASVLIQPILPAESTQNIQEAILGGLSSFLADKSTLQQRDMVSQALATALNESWATVVAAAALSIVTAILLKRDKLFQQPS